MKKIVIFSLIAILLSVIAITFADVKLMVWAEEPTETITAEITTEEIAVSEEIEVLKEISENIKIIMFIILFAILLHYSERWFKLAVEMINSERRR